MEPERRKYKYRGNHSEVLLKIALWKFSLWKIAAKEFRFWVNLQARGKRISVPIFELPLTLRAKERLTQCDQTFELTMLGQDFPNFWKLGTAIFTEPVRLELIYKWFILAMKSSGKYKTKRWKEGECALLRCGVVEDHFNIYSVVVTTSKMEEYLSREEEIIVRNWKKGNLKTKKLSEITNCIRWTRALSAISSRQNQSSASLKLRKYVFSKTWKQVIATSISKNK